MIGERAQREKGIVLGPRSELQNLRGQRSESTRVNLEARAFGFRSGESGNRNICADLYRSALCGSGLEHFHPVSSLFLGPVQGLVRFLDEVVELAGVLAENGDAKAHREVDVAAGGAFE